MTHWKKLTNPNYLGAYSIEDGKDLVLTIGQVREETVIGTDGKKESCVVCHWQENAKPMIFNATNMKQITKLLKTPFIEEWTGKKIQIGIEKVKAFGEIVEALRVRAFLPIVQSEKEIKCAECGEVIKPFGKMNAAQMAAYTTKNYGRALCSECAKKEADKKAGVTNAETNSAKQG